MWALILDEVAVMREIERKFLLVDTTFLAGERGTRIAQGYLASTECATVRVRMTEGQAWLTIKGRSEGIARTELEYEIPPEHAQLVLEEMCISAIIDKTRYRVSHGGHVWEIDVFHGDNAGLVIAEIELRNENEPFECPSWLGVEVTQDPRYYNANLATHPFRAWRQD